MGQCGFRLYFIFAIILVKNEKDKRKTPPCYAQWAKKKKKNQGNIISSSRSLSVKIQSFMKDLFLGTHVGWCCRCIGQYVGLETPKPKSGGSFFFFSQWLDLNHAASDQNNCPPGAAGFLCLYFPQHLRITCNGCRGLSRKTHLRNQWLWAAGSWNRSDVAHILLRKSQLSSYPSHLPGLRGAYSWNKQTNILITHCNKPAN